jgi:hypothetical protein
MSVYGGRPSTRRDYRCIALLDELSLLLLLLLLLVVAVLLLLHVMVAVMTCCCVVPLAVLGRCKPQQELFFLPAAVSPLGFSLSQFSLKKPAYCAYLVWP